MSRDQGRGDGVGASSQPGVKHETQSVPEGSERSILVRQSPPSFLSLVATDGRWCLARWMAGETAKCLLARGGPALENTRATFDVERELSFCGPLAVTRFPDNRVRLGFPNGRVGKIELFDTPEQATEWIEQKGDHISIDIPTPVEVLHFSCTEYSHWDGSKKTLYGDGDIRLAFAAYFIRIGMLSENEDRYAKVEVQCVPRFDRIGEYRPTREQAERLNAKARKIDEQLRASSVSGSNPKEG